MRSAHPASSLHVDALELPMAPIGPVNPLPPLAQRPVAPYRLAPDSLPAAVVENARYGAVDSLMPYLMQDGYPRDREAGTLPVVVLDNGFLRAIFAPGLGGRLWSLTDLRTGRELLYRNPVLQPANLALRNAWFAGGVEWNIGTRGHSPTTCSPLHAARVAGPGGVPMLRMWEYERLRGTVFQIDAWLPEGAVELRVYVRVRNTTPRTAPVYWWSNTAVPEQVRVLAPADQAFCTSYDGTVATRPVPWQDGGDRSYPMNAPHAGDFFFDTGGITRPWIMAVDEQGVGLAQTSTSRLAGRKLFVWGQSTGGRHWIDWLSPGNSGYAEIQAGLAATQFEHLPLPPGASGPEAGWSWLETYGPVRLDADRVHGDWADARAHAEELLDRRCPPDALAAELAAAVARADTPPEAWLGDGSGWGALERHRRAAGGLDWCDETGTPFPDRTIGSEQHRWLTLLAEGELPDSDPAVAPGSYVGGAGSEADWGARLSGQPGWLAAYHRAVLAHQMGERATAEVGYRESLACAQSAWALRGAALLRIADEQPRAAADLLLRAYDLAPGCWQLAVETGDALLAAECPDDCLALVDSLPAQVGRHGRVRMVEVRAALAAGREDRAREILDAGLTVPDMREGEASLDALWARAFGDRPVPARYDFRMHPGTGRRDGPADPGGGTAHGPRNRRPDRTSDPAAAVDGEDLALDVGVVEQQHPHHR